MKIKRTRFSFFTVILIALSIAVVIPTSNGFTQNSLRIYEEIGGGGNQGSSTVDNSDNTLLYVAGGVVLAGIIVYAIIKNKQKEKDEADTTASLSGINGLSVAAEFNDLSHELVKAKDKIPVDVYLGIKNEKAFISDKTYLMGVSIRF